MGNGIVKGSSTLSIAIMEKGLL